MMQTDDADQIIEAMRSELRGIIERINAALDADSLEPLILITCDDAVRITAALAFNLEKIGG